MFHEEALVTTIFKGLNVLVLCGVGYYFFKTRVIHWLWQEILDKKEAERAVLRERDLLMERTKQLEQTTEDQRRLCTKVKNNILIWNESIDRARQEQKEKMLERAAVNKARIATQSEFLTQYKIRQAIAGSALRDARAVLGKKSATEYDQGYVQKIISYLKESGS